MKNKKLLFTIAGVAVLGMVAILMTGARQSGWRHGDDRMSLPAPTVHASHALRLMDARLSTKSFDGTREIDEQTLSNILWAAWGMNSRGTRTIPTAGNRQDMSLYAVTPYGAYLYDAANNHLIEITDEDLRPVFARQGFVMDAYLTLVFVGRDVHNATLHAGSSYQNVSLYAAEIGLGAVVRGMFDRAEAAAALGIGEDEQVITTMTVGWPQN